MNNLITDVKSLEIETLKNLKNSKANNTLRAYQSDFKDFSAFCAKNGFSSIPTQPKIIALYLTNLSKSSKFSTLKRRIASISVIHKQLNKVKLNRVSLNSCFFKFWCFSVNYGDYFLFSKQNKITS